MKKELFLITLALIMPTSNLSAGNHSAKEHTNTSYSNVSSSSTSTDNQNKEFKSIAYAHHTPQILPKLVEIINEEEKEILIAVLTFTNVTRITEALIKKAKEGVKIDIIVNSKPQPNLVKILASYDNISLFRCLPKDNRGIMHNKFWIFKHNKANNCGLVVTGSCNNTQKAYLHNNEDMVFLNDPNLIESYAKKFYEIKSTYINRAKILASAKNNPTSINEQITNHNKITLNINTQTSDSPSDQKMPLLIDNFNKKCKSIPYAHHTPHILPNLIEIINEEKKEILIAVYTFTNVKKITEALIKRAQEGVKIDIVVGSKPNSDLVDLLTSHENISFFSCPPKGNRGIMHNKFWIFKHNNMNNCGFVATGSCNNTLKAYQHNNDNMVFLNNPDVIKNYVKTFNKIKSIYINRAKTLAQKKVDHTSMNAQTSNHNKVTLNNNIQIPDSNISLKDIVDLVLKESHYKK